MAVLVSPKKTTASDRHDATGHSTFGFLNTLFDKLYSKEPSAKQDRASDIRDAKWNADLKKEFEVMKQQLNNCTGSVASIVSEPARIGAESGLGKKVADRLNDLLARRDVSMTPEQRKDIKKAVDFLINLTPEKFLNKDVNTPWSVLVDAHASLTSIEGAMKNREFDGKLQIEVNRRWSEKAVRISREFYRKENARTQAPESKNSSADVKTKAATPMTSKHK